MCKEKGVFELNNTTITATALGDFDIENLNLVSVLFQTGYLTVKSYNSLLRVYELDYPNIEVKSAFVEGLLEVYSLSKEPISSVFLSKLYSSLVNQSAEELTEVINLVFAQIPYDLWFAENEKFYHIITHLMFTLFGSLVQSEMHTQKGKADIVIFLNNAVYCLELKLDKSAEEALNQIKSRGYLERFANSGKTLHQIGINFSSKEKKVDGLIWEVV